MITIWKARNFREGRWLNGMGLSWDIASEPPDAGAADFEWRFAIARIDADVPFSRYEKVDRIFTLISGEGLTLNFEGLSSIMVDQQFVPHAFPGDVPTTCRLHGGPCRALNLFLARGKWSADVSVVNGAGEVRQSGLLLLFAPDSDVQVGDLMLREGDAGMATGPFGYKTGTGHLYAARLTRLW